MACLARRAEFVKGSLIEDKALVGAEHSSADRRTG